MTEGATPAAPPAGPPARGLGRMLGLTALVAAILFAPALLGDGQFAYRDSGRMHLPTKRWIASEVARGHLPQWNPYAGFGAPVLANAIDAPLHPFTLLTVLLPFDWGYKAWILLSYLLAGGGAWLLARVLGRSFAAAALAGLAFAFSGYLVSSSDNVTYLTTLATAPWVTALGLRFALSGGTGTLLGAAVASLLAALAGDPQGWGIALLLVPALALAADGEAPRRARLGRAALAVGVGLAAAAVAVLPVVLFVPDSSRGERFDELEYTRWNMHPLRLAELVLPHLLRGEQGVVFNDVYFQYAGNGYAPTPWVLSLYAGVSVVALAAAGASRDRAGRWLLLGAALFAWTAMGPHAGWGQLARHLPVVGGLRYWEKMAAWTTLLVALAAASGVDGLLRDRAFARRAALGAGAAGLALLAARLGLGLDPARLAGWLRLGGEPAQAAAAATLARNLLEGLATSGLVLLLLALTAGALGAGRLPRLAPAALVLLCTAELGGADLRAYVLSPPEVTRPAAPLADRVRAEPGMQRVVSPFNLTGNRWPELYSFENAWRWGARTLAPAFNVEQRISNTEPYVAMIPIRPHRWRLRIGLYKQPPVAGLFGAGFVTVPLRPELARDVGLSPPWDVAAVDPELPAVLLRLPGARPRAYVAREVREVDRRGAMEFALDPASGPSPVSVVEEPLPPGADRASGTARIVVDEGERLELEVETDARSLLVLNDAYCPGWSATVDGAPARIVPANYLARGLWLEPGAHRVVYRYRTPGLAAGAALSGGVLALLSALWWRERRRRRAG